jgi:hypothetical protein
MRLEVDTQPPDIFSGYLRCRESMSHASAQNTQVLSFYFTLSPLSSLSPSQSMDFPCGLRRTAQSGLPSESFLSWRSIFSLSFCWLHPPMEGFCMGSKEVSLYDLSQVSPPR